MRIAVIGRCLPSNKDSFGKFEFDQAYALTHLTECDVVYCYSDNRSIKAHRRIGLESTVLDGVSVVGRYLPVGGLPWKTYNVLRTSCHKKLLSDINRLYGKPDVVYAHFPALTLSKGLIEELHRLEIPLVCLEHWSKVKNGSLSKGHLELLSLAVDYSKSVMCVSEDLADSLAKLTGYDRRKIDVVPNMVRQGVFHSFGSVEQKENNSQKRRVFVSAGRLIKMKQFDLLIRAFAAIQGHEDCELRIAGSGIEERRLRRLAKRLGVFDKVVFLGWVDSRRMAELLMESDCFVLANGNETFALPFAEAWMCGTFCIGADDNPLRSYFDGKRGLLFHKNDVSSLAETMILSLKKSKGSPSKAIAVWANNRFSEEAVVKQVMKHLSCATN